MTRTGTTRVSPRWSTSPRTRRSTRACPAHRVGDELVEFSYHVGRAVHKEQQFRRVVGLGHLVEQVAERTTPIRRRLELEVLHRREPYPGASALSHPGARALNRVPAASEIT